MKETRNLLLEEIENPLLGKWRVALRYEREPYYDPVRRSYLMPRPTTPKTTLEFSYVGQFDDPDEGITFFGTFTETVGSEKLRGRFYSYYLEKQLLLVDLPDGEFLAKHRPDRYRVKVYNRNRFSLYDIQGLADDAALDDACGMIQIRRVREQPPGGK